MLSKLERLERAPTCSCERDKQKQGGAQAILLHKAGDYENKTLEVSLKEMAATGKKVEKAKQDRERKATAANNHFEAA
mgnify:CR=1 FL=1